MKKIFTSIGLSLCSFFVCSAQTTGYTENFNDNIKTGWSNNTPYYSLTETNQEMQVVATTPATNYNTFSFTVPGHLNLSNYPYVKLSIKSATNVGVRVDLADTLNWTTNKTGLSFSVAGGAGYTTYTYDFTGLFYQQYPATNPGTHTVDQTAINKIMITFNAGGAAFNGTVYLDDLLIGSATGILPPPPPPNPNIRLNQLGFYPNRPKMAIGVGAAAGPFYILSSDKQDTLFNGTLSSSANWSFSGETVRKADFSSFDSTGSFCVYIPGLGDSPLFDIKPSVHHDAARASIKAFYYQRASTPLPVQYAGTWARSEGHPDSSVIVHNSAANSYRPTGTIIKAPKGWYDAGDYNKYVVNAGITTYQLMALYEHYSTYFDTLNTNIPETGNNIPDLLDEILWEVRWLLAMQDSSDGGVYFKLTSPNFGATTMPNADHQPRYVVQKSTSSALDFAAVLAQAARIFSRYPTDLPGLSDSCINAAASAWRWARVNPNIAYVQANLTNPAINTGAYGDGTFTDEFKWAASELYTTTKLDSFYLAAGSFGTMNVPGWQNVGSLAYYTLSHYRKQLTPAADTNTIKSRVQTFANSFRSQTGTSPYGVSIGTNSWDFSWGSNGQAANEGMALMMAFDQTRDSTYLNAALTNLDYMLGRNATNYSFLTGYGTTPPKNIHHSQSYSDGISAPVPGLLAGGPNTDQLTDCGAANYPSSTLKAKAYLDSYCSYSTNEIAINWNAPFAYLCGGIEAIEAKISPSVMTFSAVNIDPSHMSGIPSVVTGITKTTSVEINLTVYPNPSSTEFIVEFENKGTSKMTLSDLAGKKINESNFSQNGPVSAAIKVENLAKGIYILTVTSEKGSGVKKIIVQ
jgi:endoglucanase